MIEWKHLFRSHILERGWDYYQSGCVRNVKPIGRGFTAIVDGSHEYDVSIILEDGHVIDMFCDCPYAEDGSHCKHMAAVLYRISEEDFEEYIQLYKKNQENEKQELEEIISKIPQKELAELLLQLAIKDSSLKSDIILKYAGTISEKRMKELEAQMDNIAAEYADRYGYIDWEDVYDYICELESFIYDTVQKLLENKHCLEAFELVNKALSGADEQDMDDANGELMQLGSTCYDLWKQILEECNEEQKRQIYEVMKCARMDRQISAFVLDYMNDFLIYEFRDASVLKEKLEILDQEIELALKNKEYQWNIEYYVESSLVQRVHIMEEMNFPENEIREYRRKYWKFPAMRIMEIDACLKQGKVQEAIEILKESKELDKESFRTAAGYSARLIELYNRGGQKEEYKQELMFYIFTYRQNNLDYVMKLKNVTDHEEWKVYSERILKEKSCEQIRYDFMEKEKMYETLLKMVLKESYIGILDRYEKVLKKEFPIQVRDKYISYVNQYAEHASDRNAYRNLMVYLKKIKNYPDGGNVTNKISAEWREKYRRRRAMMEELKMAGF